MSYYTKLFQSMLESTIWLEPAPIKVVWITLLAMADRHGVVEASVPGLARRAGVDRTDCERALALFMAPDPDSRTQTQEGRRIEVVDGGWRLINHAKYRAKMDADDRREYLRLKQQQHRAKQRTASTQKSTLSTNVTDRSGCLPVSTHAEAKAEADLKADPDPVPGSSEGGTSRAHDPRARVTRSPRGPGLSGSHLKCFFAPEACARGLCIPGFLGEQWRQQVGTDPAPEARVAEFIGATLAAMPAGAVGDDPLPFWRGAWKRRHGSAIEPARAQGKGEQTVAAIQRVIQRRQQLREGS